MKRFALHWTAIGVMCTVPWTGAALADPPQQMTPAGNQPQPYQQSQSGKKFHSTAMDKLVGKAAKNRAGTEIGTIKDFAIDPVSGRIVYGVLSCGGFMGLGEKLFAIPWSSFEKTSADNAPVVDVTKQQLEDSRGFDADRWPNMADREWAQRTHRSFNQTPYWESTNADSTREPERVMPTTIVRATKLDGAEVKNRSDETIGTVSDLVIDCCQGRVAAADITCNAVLGIGGETRPVPWKSLTVTRLDDGDVRVTTNLTRDQVTRAPKLTSHTDHETQPIYLVEVYRHYNVQPYWAANDMTYESGQGANQQRGG